MKPEWIWFVIGNDFWALGAKLDWTLYFKCIYLLFFVAGWVITGRRAGLLMMISAIFAAEFEQGLMYRWNAGNYFGVFDFGLVVILAFGAYWWSGLIDSGSKEIDCVGLDRSI